MSAVQRALVLRMLAGGPQRDLSLFDCGAQRNTRAVMGGNGWTGDGGRLAFAGLRAAGVVDALHAEAADAAPPKM